MKFFPMSLLMVGMLGLSACGGGSSSNGNSSTDTVEDSSNTVANKVIGYSVDHEDLIDYYTLKFSIENDKLTSELSSFVGSLPDLSSLTQETVMITDDVIYKIKNDLIDNKKIILNNFEAIKSDKLSATFADINDSEMTVTYNLSEQDISGRKITDVVDMYFTDELSKAINELPSTMNTFGKQQVCTYESETVYSKPLLNLIDVTDVSKEDFQNRTDLSFVRNPVEITINGIDWVMEKEGENSDSGYGIGLFEDKVWSGEYFFAGSFKNDFARCDYLTKEQADFVADAIKMAVANG